MSVGNETIFFFQIDTETVEEPVFEAVMIFGGKVKGGFFQPCFAFEKDFIEILDLNIERPIG